MSSEIDRLEIQIEAQAQKANSQLDALSKKLNNVATSLQSLSGSQKNQITSTFSELGSAITSFSGLKTTDFSRVVKNINRLGNIDTQALYKSSNSLRNFTNSINGASNLYAGIENLTQLSASISKLGSKGVSSAISNLPALATGINNLLTTLSKSPAISGDITKLTTSLASLVGKGNNLRSVSKNLSSPLKEVTNATRKYADANYRAEKYSSTLISKLMKLSAVLFSLRSAYSFVSGSIEKAMNYEETINLFQTSMKKIGLTSAKGAGYEMGTAMAESYAISFMNKANDFAEDISNKLSLDPNMVKNYQAMFAQMADSMGLVSDSAYNISTSLTMLGNDMASLFNVDTKTMMEKLQSGLSGEIEPLRRLGIDISQSSLALTAQRYGIEGSVEQMSAAAKVQLRWLSIMDQTTVAWGDMAKTIESPANQIRILRQQWDNLTRSIGNLFLPVLQTVLPYVNGFLIALRNITDAFATMLGYELPDYSDSEIFTGVTGGIDDVGSSADDASDSVNKLSKAVSKFDELNILNQNNSNSKKDSESGIPSLDGEISKKTTNYLEKFNQEMDKVKNKAKELSEVIQPKLEWFIDKLKELTPVFLGVATGVGAYKLMSWLGYLGKTLTTLGMTKTGIIAIAIGALVLLGTAIYKAWEDARKARLDTMFGDITLSAEELEKVAKRIADNGTLDFVAHAKLEWEELAEIEKSLDKKVETINRLNRKVQVGLELSEDEQGLYKRTIQEYISEINTYVDHLEESTLLSISLVVKDDDLEKELLSSYTGYFNNIRNDISKSAKDLQEAVNKAWSDGLLDIDEAKEIAELQQHLVNIQKSMTDAEYNARAQIIKSQFSGADLTKESYKELTKQLEELQKQYEKDYKDTVGVKLLTQAEIKLQYAKNNANTPEDIDKAIKEYNKEVKAYTEGMQIDIDGFDLNIKSFKTATVIDAVSNAVSEIEKDLQEDLESIFGDESGNLGVYLGEYYKNFKKYTKALGDDSIELVKDFVEKSKPTKTQYEAIVKKNTEAGEAVPKSISDGLAAIYLAEAIAGNVDSLYALIGTQVGNTKEFQGIIDAVNEQGVEVNEELLKGIQLGKTDLTIGFGGFIQSVLEDAQPGINTSSKSYGKITVASYGSGIKEGIPLSEAGMETWVSSVLKKARKDLGIKDGTASSTIFADYAKYSMNGFNNYIANNGKTTETKMGTWAQTYIMKPFTKKLDINSPSKVFNIYGQNTVDGFNNGISGNQSKSESVIGTWVSKISGWFTSKLGIHSPSRVFAGYAENVTDGFNNKLEDNMGSTANVIERWGDVIKDSASGIKIDPLMFESNYRVNTSGIDGFEDLISNRTLTINTMKSSAASSGEIALSEEAMYRVFRRALDDTTMQAIVGEDSVFQSVRHKNKEFRNMTGRGAFPY